MICHCLGSAGSECVLLSSGATLWFHSVCLSVRPSVAYNSGTSEPISNLSSDIGSSIATSEGLLTNNWKIKALPSAHESKGKGRGLKG